MSSRRNVLSLRAASIVRTETAPKICDRADRVVPLVKSVLPTMTTRMIGVSVEIVLETAIWLLQKMQKRRGTNPLFSFSPT